MSGLLGKVVVVTGAGRGTGRSHCERFADEGADVIAIDIASAATDLGVTAAEVEKRGRRCVNGLADVCDFEALTAVGRRRGSRTRPAGRRRRQRRYPRAGRAGLGDHRGRVAAHAGRQPHRRVAHGQGRCATHRRVRRLSGDHQLHQRFTRHRQHRALHRQQACGGGFGAHPRQRTRPAQDPRQHRASRRCGHIDGAQRGDIQTAATRSAESDRPRTPPKSSRRATCFRCRGWSPSTSPMP